jgi:hypothetical protein
MWSQRDHQRAGLMRFPTLIADCRQGRVEKPSKVAGGAFARREYFVMAQARLRDARRKIG